jgi:parvulin-like peptidyl-prolyl isomerase
VTERRSGSGTFWLVGVVLLVTAAGVFYAVWPRRQPERVTVQHILLSFQGTRTAATRTQAQAEKLATETFNRARNGTDFDMLMKALSDDPAGGTYTMCNTGVTPGPGEFGRERMVPAFGDLSFKLQVGEIGLAPYDAKSSPFGWHILKRLR